MLRGTDIVCISSLDWEAHWTSKQQIMRRLAESNRILYVEEPVTMLAPFRVPSRWRRWRSVAPRLRRAQPGLWILTPPPMLPFGNMYPPLNRGNQEVLARYIRWAMKSIGMSDAMLWTYLPTSCALIDRLDPKSIVYHCVDEHSAFPGYVTPSIVRAYDEELTRRADLVITSAYSLMATRRHLNPHMQHVRHAADVSHFRTALEPDLEVPADIASIPTPRLGVVGVHDERLDVKVLETLAKADPSWHIVLVGPVRPGDVDESKLRALPNVHFLGNKPMEELPAYLKALNVALIPYKLNELTRNIFPLKLFEYLAAGLPVVSCDLPELAPYADCVGLATKAEDYPDLVRAAIASDSLESRRTRSILAGENTWESRVEEISDLVEEMLARKGLAPDGRLQVAVS